MLAGIAALFVNNGIMLAAAVLVGHTVYVLSEAAHRRAADALAAVLLCLDADMLLIPFMFCDEDMKSYSFYGLVILLSLSFAGLYRINDKSAQWLAAVKESSVRVYAVLCCIPVLSTAAAVLIQRLCAEHYTLSESKER